MTNNIKPTNKTQSPGLKCVIMYNQMSATNSKKNEGTITTNNVMRNI